MAYYYDQPSHTFSEYLLVQAILPAVHPDVCQPEDTVSQVQEKVKNRDRNEHPDGQRDHAGGI